VHAITEIIFHVILLLVCSDGLPSPFGTVFPHLYALMTASLVLGQSSRLICLQDICSQSTVRTSDTLTRSFACYKFVTDFLIYRSTYSITNSLTFVFMLQLNFLL